ncbi:MAG: S-layer protein domain-containing protein, partial [Methanothrix sp.]
MEEKRRKIICAMIFQDFFGLHVFLEGRPKHISFIIPFITWRIEMKRQLIITLFLIALLQLTGNSVEENMSSLEIRGSVATGSAEWDASTFAGFYYDIDDNIATETMTFTVTD